MKKLYIFLLLFFILILILSLANYKIIKGYLLYSFETCNTNCSLANSNSSTSPVEITCSICSKKCDVIPNMIMCPICSSITKRCSICGKLIKNDSEKDYSNDKYVLIELSTYHREKNTYDSDGKLLSSLSFQYNGIFVDNNGSIYKFDIPDSNIILDKYELIDSSYITPLNKSIDKADLVLIKNYISQITASSNNIFLFPNTESSISISIYKENENSRIILEDTFNPSRNNINPFTTDLLKLLKKNLNDRILKSIV